MKIYKTYILIIFFFVSAAALFAQPSQWTGPSAQEAFDKPNLYPQKELYKMAREALAAGCLDEARLFALRLFFSGSRNQNLLNLLGVIEIQNERPLLASEWLRKANSLSLNNKVAQRYLSRLPSRPRAIPVDPLKLADHFTEISTSLPSLVERLTNRKLHLSSIFKTLERGQFYMALALSEEFEKRYPGPDGHALTALCAWYLGRNKDALDLVETYLKTDAHNDLLLFVKAMVLDSHPATSSQSYFRALYDLDQWTKALSLADAFSKQFPKSPEAYITQARIYLDMNKVKEAAVALQEAGLRDPGNPEIELLWVGYLLQRGESQKAAKRLQKTFKRGYNVPSISLSSALFALQNGNFNEVNAVLNDIISYRPFNDPEAYPSYVTLLLLCDRVPDARAALDEWKGRVGELSIVCYLEAFYHFKTGVDKEAMNWLRKAYQKGPDRLSMLQFMSGYPALADDPKLFSEVNTKITLSSMGASSPVTKPEQLKASAKPAAAQIAASASPAAITIKGEGFTLSLGAGLDESHSKTIQPDIANACNRVFAGIGTVKDPVKLSFVSAEGLGPMIASYDMANSLVTVTTNYYDGDMVRNIILANFDSFSEEELGMLINEYPGHVLCIEIAKSVINKIIPSSKESRDKTAWMQTGLAEITAGSQISLRYKLLLANQSNTSGTAKFSSTNMLNSIFIEGYTSPAVYEMASIQSYLMTAYLIKRSASLEKGCADMMKMIESVSKGTSFTDAVKSIFGISESEFETGWKESAYWATTQGAPYEW